MDNTVRIDVEGQVITLPLKYDPHARRWLESYWPVFAHPPWTPAGRPIMLVLDNPCAHAEMCPGEEANNECGSCRYFRAVAEGLLAGVTDDQLQPQGQATRAQVAAIFERFLEA